MEKRPVRIFIADDHWVVRSTLARLATQMGYEVAGEAGDISFIDTADPASIDVWVIDLNMGHTKSVDVVRQLRAHHPEAKVLVFSTVSATPVIAAAFEAGAMGYVDKKCDDDSVLETALRTVADGETYYMPGMAEMVAKYFAQLGHRPDPQHVLTEKEMAIFVMVAEGRRSSTIAEAAGIARSTVTNRILRIEEKLGVSRDNWTRFALDLNLILPS